MTIADEDDVERVLTLVGDDENRYERRQGRLERANRPRLRGAGVGDVRRVMLPAGERDYEVIAICYPTSNGPFAGS